MARLQLASAQLDDNVLAANRAFVYVIVAGAGGQVCFYVGQTKGREGALGRLAEHLSDGDNATFRNRVWSCADADIVGAVHFVGVPLSGERAFQLPAPDYREAVEWMIERELREFVAISGLNALSVARVRHNGYVNTPLARREAAQPLVALQQWLERAITLARAHSVSTAR